jgi:hypothetical protein
MTTLAFDGKILAADSLYVGDSEYVYGHESKIYIFANMAISISGEDTRGQAFVRWITEDSCNDKKYPTICKDTFAGLLLTSEGCFEFAGNCKGKGSKVRMPACYGSGHLFAKTAMGMGKNAHEAVEVACDHCIFTGPPVYSITQKQLAKLDPNFQGLWEGKHNDNRSNRKTSVRKINRR